MSRLWYWYDVVTTRSHCLTVSLLWCVHPGDAHLQECDRAVCACGCGLWLCALGLASHKLSYLSRVSTGLGVNPSGPALARGWVDAG